MREIILVFDSFKGSVDATDITYSLTKTIQEEWPGCKIHSFPIADGGEGTLQAISECKPLIKHTCKVHGPLQEMRTAAYATTQEGIAIIEMATANGLPLVPIHLRNPMDTTTLGTGEMITDALDKGYRKFIIGLGGSATNDAGIGVMHALGVRFLDEAGRELPPTGRNLISIASIDKSRMRSELSDCSFTLACDVTNPFYGKQGAAYVFAPQKGASEEEVSMLDKGLQSYATCLLRTTGRDITNLPGAGAAGGMGGGLSAFLNTELKSGIDIILDLTNFNNTLKHADVVFTGEGKIDRQTGMGKALNGILNRALSAGVPVIGIGGSIEDVETLNKLGFTALFSIQPAPTSLERAMQKDFALQNLNQTVIQTLRVINSFSK